MSNKLFRISVPIFTEPHSGDAWRPCVLPADGTSGSEEPSEWKWEHLKCLASRQFVNQWNLYSNLNGVADVSRPAAGKWVCSVLLMCDGRQCKHILNDCCWCLELTAAALRKRDREWTRKTIDVWFRFFSFFRFSLSTQWDHQLCSCGCGWLDGCDPIRNALAAALLNNDDAIFAFMFSFPPSHLLRSGSSAGLVLHHSVIIINWSNKIASSKSLCLCNDVDDVELHTQMQAIGCQHRGESQWLLWRQSNCECQTSSNAQFNSIISPLATNDSYSTFTPVNKAKSIAIWNGNLFWNFHRNDLNIFGMRVTAVISGGWV